MMEAPVYTICAFEGNAPPDGTTLHTMNNQSTYRNAELDAILAERGGIFRVDISSQEFGSRFLRDVLSGFKWYAGYATHKLYTLKKRPIEFGLISASKLNAFAYASSDQDPRPFDFIGVNVGSAVTLLNLFNRVFAHPKNFALIGKASDEEAPADTFLTTDAIESNFEQVLPKCLIRRTCALQCAEICISQLFAHEITHLQHGHLELLRHGSEGTLLDEQNGPQAQSNDNNLRSQALEMDADRGAVTIVMELTRHRYGWLNQDKSLDPHHRAACAALFGNSRELIGTITFALYMMHRNFDVPWAWWQSDRCSHPLPAVRMFAAIWSIVAYLERNSPPRYDQRAFLDECDRIIHAAETACARMTGKEIDQKMIQSVAVGSIYGTYSEQVKAMFEKLKPTLHQFARG